MELLTVNELADYYKVERTTIYAWLKKGLPYEVTPSGRKRFDLINVATWCDKIKATGEEK